MNLLILYILFEEFSILNTLFLTCLNCLSSVDVCVVIMVRINSVQCAICKSFFIKVLKLHITFLNDVQKENLEKLFISLCIHQS